MRLQEFEYMTDKQYDSTDYDIWKATEEAIESAKLVEITLHHVKAHQREELYEIKGEEGPLTRGATYNDWCDKAAEQE